MTEDYGNREEWPDKRLLYFYGCIVSTSTMSIDEQEELEAVGNEILRRMADVPRETTGDDA